MIINRNIDITSRYMDIINDNKLSYRHNKSIYGHNKYMILSQYIDIIYMADHKS